MRQIIFSDTLPKQGKGLLIHYSHSVVKSAGWKLVDIRGVVKENEDAWLNEIKQWHDTLMKKLDAISPWWSLLPVSRLILWETTTSFSLKPLLFFLALVHQLEKTDENICIVRPSKNLVDYINEWALSNTVLVEDNRKFQFKTYFPNFLSYHLRNLLLLSTLFFLIVFRTKKKIKPAKLIINSTFLNEKLLVENGDHFFGLMLDQLKTFSSDEIIWLYNDMVIKNRDLVDDKLKKMGRHGYFLSDFFRWSDLLFACFNGYSIIHNIKRNLKKILFPIQIEGLQSNLFTYSYIENLALNQAPFTELMVYRQFRRIIEHSSAEFMIYPYEEKTLEHAMLMANISLNNQVETIGYAHAGYSKGHLYIKRNNSDLIPRPECIATTGLAPKNRFVLSGVPDGQICVVGTPRFQFYTPKYQEIKNKSCLRILFICGLGFELLQLAEMLIEYRKIADENNIIIRRSFHSWKKEQDRAEQLLIQNNIPYQIDDSDLMKEIDQADIVLYESTSAAFQASLRGKLVFKVCLSDIVMTEHFMALDDNIADLDKCANAVDLLNTINMVKLMDNNEYMNLAKKQRVQFKTIFQQVNASQIETLFVTEDSQ